MTVAKRTGCNYCLRSQVQVILQWKINQSLTFRAKYQRPWQGQSLYQPELQPQQLDSALSWRECASSDACILPVNVLLHFMAIPYFYPVFFQNLTKLLLPLLCRTLTLFLLFSFFKKTTADDKKLRSELKISKKKLKLPRLMESNQRQSWDNLFLDIPVTPS